MGALKRWFIDTINETCNLLAYAARWGIVIVVTYALWYTAGLLGVIIGAVFWSSYKRYKKDND